MRRNDHAGSRCTREFRNVECLEDCLIDSNDLEKEKEKKETECKVP